MVTGGIIYDHAWDWTEATTADAEVEATLAVGTHRAPGPGRLINHRLNDPSISLSEDGMST